MTKSLGPWTTSMGPETRHQLDSFWQRRLKRLVAVSRGRHLMSWWMVAGLMVITSAVLLLPTIHGLGSSGVLAQDQAAPERDAKSDSATEPSKPTDRVEYFPQPSAEEQKILEALEKPISLEFVDTPLGEVVDFIRQATEVAVVVDTRALSEEGLSRDEPVSIQLDKIRLKSGLNLLLSPLGLDYVVRDEVLMITSKIAAEERLSTRAYPVGDLAPSSDDLVQLQETIESTVPDAYWQTIDGMGGTIATAPASSTLVIQQTFRGHEEVRQLLSNLRKAQQVDKVSRAASRQP